MVEEASSNKTNVLQRLLFKTNIEIQLMIYQQFCREEKSYYTSGFTEQNLI